MTTTLEQDKQGQLTRLRDEIMEDIETAWAGLQTSMEQLRRRHYYRLGELFIQLRTTFDKGKKGDTAFVAFCRSHGPKIENGARQEYITYRKLLGKVGSRSDGRDLPPLRKITDPAGHRKDANRPREQYRRIVNDEVNDPEVFSGRTRKEDLAQLVIDLAEKIINAGFRVLSVKMHPDNGGSNEAQKRLGMAKKLLQDALLRESLRR